MTLWPVKTLLLDNYDSFTYNLFQLLAQVNGDEPLVVRNDAAGWSELRRLEFDNIVVSAGPGSPEHEGDFGVCAQAIEQAEVPLLGVCLGHQGLAWVHGATVQRAPVAMHGRTSAVVHDGSRLFAGIPREFQAVRYHSLCVAQPLPAALQAIARTTDDVVMALAHRTRPQWGVQFHPESICTEHGRRLLANFGDLTRERAAARGRASQGTHAASPADGRCAGTRARQHAQPRKAERSPDAARPGPALQVRRLDMLHDPERTFLEPLRRRRHGLLAGQQQGR